MANPTTNFGWVMPVAADLVTNLPTQFNTFGQGVDTTLAELKGGTTGQLLSKTSATDMDFTWTSFGSWTTYTPTLNSMSLGNGTVTGRYVQIGKTVTFSFKFVLGSTSTVSASPSFTLPTTPRSLNNIITTTLYADDNTGGRYIASVYGLPAFPTSLYLTTANSGALSFASTTTPFTWATSDVIYVTGSYETT